MTEAELWSYLRDATRERKERLFECACCRQVWQELKDERSRQAIIVAEEYADGLATDEELQLASDSACVVWDADRVGVLPPSEVPHNLFLHMPYSAAAYNVAIPMGWWGGAPAFDAPSSIIAEAAPDGEAMRASQLALLRDIVGNPARPIVINPAWLMSDVVALAHQIYEARDFSAMPILADAIQDAGCDNDDILNHCRQPGEHVRGCWVVDLVLGKK